MKNILVTGGAGYIGNEIINVLKESSDNKVFVIDSLLYTPSYLKNVNFTFGDVSDISFMRNYLAKTQIDVIIHMAGIVGDEACRIHRIAAYSTNVESVKILKDIFNGVIIFPSSCSVYGKNSSVLDEDSPVNPLSFYGENKVEAEEILKDRDKTRIYRLGTVHGIVERFRNDLVVHTLTLKALIHGKMQVYGDQQWRPLVHVKDVARTFCQNLDIEKFEIFNLSSKNYRIIEIAEHIQKRLPTALLEITNIPFEDERNYRVSNAKIKAKFLADNYTIDDTINDIIGVYKDGRIKNFSDIIYSNVGKVEFKI